MSDFREKFVTDVSTELAVVYDAETASRVTEIVVRLLSDYEITQRTTDLAPYDDANQKVIKRYCACLMVDGKSKHTIDQYRRTVTALVEFFRKPVTEIGTYDIRYYLANEKDRGLSNRSVENTRSYISAFFQWLTAEEIIDKNPCAKIKPIKFTDEVRKPFSDVEMDALRSNCKSLKERAIVEVLASSGVRVSELTALEVSDIDFTALSVHVRQGKGNKERVTYISNVAATYLRKYLMARTEATSILFCNHTHEALNAGGVRHILKTLGKRANVEDVHPHRFRRTFATGLAARGMSIQEIMRLLGHSDIKTTMVYVTTNDEQIHNSYRQYIA